MAEFFTSLAAPFETIHWRAQSMAANGSSALALAYIDARDVMARLDSVVGPENWQDRYVETLKGRILCTLALRVGGEWIEKTDGAGNTDVEGDKGALSDALKRAAVKWGVGRYLYDLPATWADCESYEKNGKKHWKGWTANGLRKLQAVSGSAKAAAPVVEAETDEPAIDEAQLAELTLLLETAKADTKAFCDYYHVETVKELLASRFDHARAMLNKKIKEAA